VPELAVVGELGLGGDDWTLFESMVDTLEFHFLSNIFIRTG